MPDQWLHTHQESVVSPYGSPPTANRWSHWWGSYPSAEVQSTYSTAPADRANEKRKTHLNRYFLIKKGTISKNLNVSLSFFNFIQLNLKTKIPSRLFSRLRNPDSSLQLRSSLLSTFYFLVSSELIKFHLIFVSFEKLWTRQHILFWESTKFSGLCRSGMAYF